MSTQKPNWRKILELIAAIATVIASFISGQAAAQNQIVDMYEGDKELVNEYPDDFIEVNTSKAEFITFDFVKHGIHLFAVTFKLQNVCNMVRHSSPSSCSARKKPRTSSSTLPAGCGREIACGSELFCSSAWRIAFKSFRNCSRCAC